MTEEKEFKKRKLFNKKYVPSERRKTRLMLFIIFWGIILTYATKTFILNLEVIKGSSMYPTFKEGEYYIVNKFIYNFTRPKRGDVVIIRDIRLKKDELIKRIISVPDDIFQIKGGRVYLNRKPLEERYTKSRTFPDMGPLKVLKDMYFVMGDNRENSYDSRHFGFVQRDDIKGKLAPDKLFLFK